MLLAFIPLGALVVLMYLLKLKRREQLVSSVMLWRDAVADIQANAPFQKLKNSLLLILQLLALLALVVAVARPYLRVRGVAENRIVVILDNSVCMQSTDIKPSRFDDAKSKAMAVVNRMGPSDSMLIMTAGSKARVIAPFTSDKRTLSGAISGIKGVDTPCNMRLAVVLALSLVSEKGGSPARIVILSDGIFGSLADISPRNAKIDFLKIGKECDNVGITGISARKTLSGEQQVFVGMHNFSKRERKFNLEVYLKDQIYAINEETLAPGATKQELLKDIAGLSGRVTAKLDIDDDLSADNVGSVYLSGPRKLSILLVSQGNLFLQNALNLDPRTELTKTDSLPTDFSKQSYDLVVFDRVTPPDALPPGGYMFIDTATPKGPADAGQEVSLPSIIDSAKNHPVTSYVDFSGVRIQKARYLRPKSWATPIVETAEGALAVAGSHDGRNYVQVSWNILDSDFPLHVGFPIFVANCLDWLIQPDKVGVGRSVRVGQPMYIDVPLNLSEITVTDPTGEKQVLKVTQNPMTYDNTERVGVYKVTGKGMDREFACNLASMRESNTAPVDSFTMDGKSFASGEAAVRTNKEYYFLLVMLALIVLTFEWYAYHRRI